jgi:Sec-independent protein translocase protein TatA
MRYILYALLIWFLYQFIFKLVVPVYKTTRKIKKGFREMQEKMNEQFAQQQQQQAYSASGSNSNKSTRPPTSDYIDFEEVK